MDEDDDSIWGDIDDNVLVQMSQMAEEPTLSIIDHEEYSTPCFDEWNEDFMESSLEETKGRFDPQNKTQFPSSSNIFPTFKKPKNDFSHSSKFVKQESKLNGELERKNKVLSEEVFAKRGEVSLLRADLRKLTAELESERKLKAHILSVKNLEEKRAAEEKAKALESIETDRKFLAHQLRQTEETLKMTQSGRQSRKMDPESGRLSRKNAMVQTVSSSTINQKQSPSFISLQHQIPKNGCFLESLGVYFLLSQCLPKDFLTHLFGSPNKIQVLKALEKLLQDEIITPEINFGVQIICNSCELREIIISSSTLSKITDSFPSSNSEMNERAFETHLKLLETLVRRQLIEVSSLKNILNLLRDSLTLLDSHMVLCQIIHFLSSTSVDSKYATLYCEVNDKKSCFFFYLYECIIRLFKNSKDTISFIQIFSEFLISHYRMNGELQWLGPVISSSITCLSCRMDILKAVAFTSFSLVSVLVEENSFDDKLISLVSKSIYILHQLWSTDPKFIQGLCDSPRCQRQYIWATQKLNNLKGQLCLSDEEEKMLVDLNVQLLSSS